MDLSILIPARHEQFLGQTVLDILKNARAETEIIIVADGEWPVEPLDQHPRVHIIHVPQSIGQRAATNLAARLSDATYVMKLDAHCALDEGFDVKLIEADRELGRPDITQIPSMKNLHVFDWKCKGCGYQTYQGPVLETCLRCKESHGFEQVLVWKPRRGTTTDSWRFDHTVHFQYWKRQTDGDLVDVMSSIGACFFMRRARFFDIGGLDEAHGSWGNFGVEIACKSWLSGGRQIVNKRTWFAHLFRTRRDFSFPYEISGNEQERAREYSRKLWLGNNWPGQTLPLSWLIDHFQPLPDWHDPVGAETLAGVVQAGEAFAHGQTHLRDGGDGVGADRAVRGALGVPAPTKGLIYYSDCRGDETILQAVRDRIQTSCNGYPVVSATLQPLDFGRQNIHVDLERGYLAMFKQILAGLEALDTDIAFLVEHDVLYHPSHFRFSPARDDTYYYNQHVYKVDAASGNALHYKCNQTSGLCANRQLLLTHYRARVARVERDGFTRGMGFEPGTRKIRHGGIDDVRYESWMSEAPNVDIRHGANLTPSRWKKEEFRNQKYTDGWTEASAIPGWGVTAGRFSDFLREVTCAAL